MNLVTKASTVIMKKTILYESWPSLGETLDAFASSCSTAAELKFFLPGTFRWRKPSLGALEAIVGRTKGVVL